MPSIESPPPFSSSVLGSKIVNNLSKEGASLEIGHIEKGKKTTQWIVKTPPKNKSRSLVKIKDIFLNFFHAKVKSPGITLYNNYLKFLQKKYSTTLTDKESKDALKIKTQAAFILSGVCQIKQKNKKLFFTRTTKPITQTVIEKLDHLTSCSPLRLTYEFIAQNQIPPKGYLQGVLHPFFVDFLLKKDPSLDIKQANYLVYKTCKDCSLLKEKDLSLETVLEIKTRLSSFAQKNSTDITQKETTSNLASIELDPPSLSLKYHCDEDDIWLIQHHVKNSRRIRIVKDMFVHAYRWRERNKRHVALDYANNTFAILASGLVSGGMSTAVGLLSIAFFTLLNASISKIGEEIRQVMVKIKIKNWEKSSADFDENEQPHHLSKYAKEFDDFMSGCAYLVNQKTLDYVLDSYADFARDINNLKKQHAKRNNSASERLRYEKLKTLIDIRRNEFKNFFSFSSITESSSGSYDQLIVDTVTEISRLEDEYQKSFELLWDNFNALPEKERLSLLNKAAYKIHGKWYHSKNHNYSSLIAKNFKDGKNSMERAIYHLVKPSSAQMSSQPTVEKTKKKSSLFLRGISKSMEVATYLISSICKVIGFNALNFEKLVLKRKLVINNPSVYIHEIISWLIYDVIGCIVQYINNLCNMKNLERINKESQTTRFDQRSDVSKKEWYALHTEAKRNLDRCIERLNGVRSEHQKMHQLLDGLKMNPKLTPHEINDQFAQIMLERQALNNNLHKLLSGAAGQLHEATVQAAWQQDQLLKALVEEDEHS